MTVTQTDQGQEFELKLLDYLLMARDADYVEIPAELHELIQVRNTVDRPRMTKYVTRELCLNLAGGRPRLEFCRGVIASVHHPAHRVYVRAGILLDGTTRTASSTELKIQLSLHGTLPRNHSLFTVVGRVETRSVWTRDRVGSISIPNCDLPREPKDFVSFLLDWEGLSPLLLDMLQDLAEITSGA